MTNTQYKYFTKIDKETCIYLKEHVKGDECRRKCLSVLSYIMKHCRLNNGCWIKSFADMHKMYVRYHKSMSLANLKKIVNKLHSLGLIFIVKINKVNAYFLDEEIANKVAREINAKTEMNATVKEAKKNTELQTIINNTNTNNNMQDVIEYYQKSYSGISGNPTASKSELKKIAKTLMNMRAVHESTVQALVFNKINLSQQKIQLRGAIKYIDTIITEKLVETTKSVMSIFRPNAYSSNLMEQVAAL